MSALDLNAVVPADRTEARLAAELAEHKRQIAEARLRIERTLGEHLPWLRLRDNAINLRTPKRMGWLLDRSGRATGRVVPPTASPAVRLTTTSKIRVMIPEMSRAMAPSTTTTSQCPVRTSRSFTWLPNRRRCTAIGSSIRAVVVPASNTRKR